MRTGTRLVDVEGLNDPYGSHIPPVYLSAVYEYVDYEQGLAKYTDRGTYVRYGREENPTVRVLERLLSSLEETEDALAFNSGMAAETTLFLYLMKPGIRVVMSAEVYSTTYLTVRNLVEKVGAKLDLVFPSAREILESVGREPAVVFVETVTNPTLKVVDLVELAEGLKDTGSTLVVDNTFATPLNVKPFKLGARFVVHSLTKYIAGHNDVVGGALLGTKKEISELWDWRRMTGSIMPPFEAYLVYRGAKTLEVRFERVSKSAKAIAEFLAEHSKVEGVHYPGLDKDEYHPIARRLFATGNYGGVLSFRVKGGYEGALRFMKKLRVIKRAPSLGGTESLAVLPAKAGSMYLPEDLRRRLKITENLVRLSVGLEDVNDLIEDIDQALA
ncbi:cystathionine gamma-synthase [Thermogladius calderae 1633]|uniref:Cystathionine gamma-synthase n=1 Tax=Thermogladius calderae (strain DSM 22663 / VKM B-2946 / 1633) TaxID=1184251 RepID=I3TEL5_THEC1|nr:cystathionine gamma-synthase family protein [Thermogladius calderae]AFK51203.1 cystathionine gamma-synthase [Thermogladius calderae 1633]